MTSDVINRSARGAIQGGAAGVLIELLEAFNITDLTPRQYGVTLIAVSFLVSFVQNFTENRWGRAFLKRVPEEPAAAE